ncbi:MAG: hypothetical protein N2111_07635 [Candidatus Sumerlaeaceae bacterium]|nr:hypothetical protein [Candidatus Sumerlaeaceae bacterium]
MRISLEKGEVLDVAITEGDRVVGSLSLTLRDLVPSAPKAAAKAPAAAAPATRKRRTGKRNVSPEARARMAEAQRRRWEAYRASKAEKTE